MTCIPTKFDTSCNLVTAISDADCIGSSLSAANANFQALDLKTCQLQASAERWDSAYTTINTLSGRWESVHTTYVESSGNWQSTRDTVGSVSANWLEPITVIYDTIFEDSTAFNTAAPLMSSFVNTNWPATGLLIDQEFYVFSARYAIEVFYDEGSVKASRSGGGSCVSNTLDCICNPADPLCAGMTPSTITCGGTTSPCGGSNTTTYSFQQEDRMIKGPAGEDEAFFGIQMIVVDNGSGNEWEYTGPLNGYPT